MATADRHNPIRERLLAKLRAGGDWRPGDKLPGGRELARVFQCSPVTMDGVLRGLAAQGFLRREARQGTFVAPHEGWGKAETGRASGRLAGILATFPEEILQAAEAELHRQGCGALVRCTGADLAAALKAVAELVARGVRGFIWSPLSTPDYAGDNDRLAAALLGTGLPAVAVDRYPEGVEVNSVVSDNASAAALLTRHLLGLGHRRIGLVRHLSGSTARDRQRGWESALAAAGVAPAPALVLAVPHDLPGEELVRRVRQWLRDTHPTAVWSIAGLPLGAAVLAAAQAERLSIPQDLSFATFDEVIAPFPVTRILQPLAETGRRAAALLRGEMEKPSGEIHRVILRCTLREGASCRPLHPRNSTT
ncbi:MAG: substrate-binding domain-containing protein [Lentisphaeria bacterium]|jgi:DNA-binding LacI/PurR family transcriptional regulator